MLETRCAFCQNFLHKEEEEKDEEAEIKEEGEAESARHVTG